jgi:hypothetical protein
MMLSPQNAGSNPTRRSVIFTAFSLLIGTIRPAALLAEPSFPAEDDPMNYPDQDFGTLNPHAPTALARFAFLLGRWKGEAKLTSATGDSQTFHVTWQGRFILDGYAIADEYRMTDPYGDLIVLGENFRTYDAATQTWNIRWLNALTGTWTNLVSPDLGGVKINGSSITYAFKEPTATHPYTRATYTSVSSNHFTWKGDQSTDAKTWTDFMLVEVDRVT